MRGRDRTQRLPGQHFGPDTLVYRPRGPGPFARVIGQLVERIHALAPEPILAPLDVFLDRFILARLLTAGRRFLIEFFDRWWLSLFALPLLLSRSNEDCAGK